MEKVPVPWLQNFIVFNTTLCKKEGQEQEKILFYYSKDETSDDAKIRQVGLCEGMINFTRRFSDNPCEVLETKRTRQVYFGPEPDFWMVLTVGVPENGCRFVSNLTMRSLLITSYNLFTLFYGPFTPLMNKLGDLPTFRAKLKRFFGPYRTTLKIGESEILDHAAGVQYLSIDPNMYLCCQRFLSSLQDRFSPVLYTMLLYKDKLIYSALDKHDTQVLYHYLINILFPAHLETSGMEFISKSLQTMGRYLNGPDNFDDNIKASRLHLMTDSVDGKLTQVFLLVYNNMDTTVCLMIDANTSCTKTFYKTLHAFLSTNVPTLDSIISKQVAPKMLGGGSSSYLVQPVNDNIRYLLYNYDNLAYVTTLHSTPHISPVFMRTISDIAAVIKDKRDADVVIKTASDIWISARKSKSRVLFSLLLQKNMHYINVVEDVRRLTQTLFSKTYFTES
ncbi:hypothetical protein ACHWQZ_G005642 [Mnemiopsis leidyi]